MSWIRTEVARWLDKGTSYLPAYVVTCIRVLPAWGLDVTVDRKSLAKQTAASLALGVVIVVVVGVVLVALAILALLAYGQAVEM